MLKLVYNNIISLLEIILYMRTSLLELTFVYHMNNKRWDTLMHMKELRLENHAQLYII